MFGTRERATNKLDVILAFFLISVIIYEGIRYRVCESQTVLNLTGDTRNKHRV